MTSQKLTFSMRSNLLNLQNIAQKTSAMQIVLASGKKVSSVLDNPSSFYTAASLSQRASDLNLLLDSMGESISALKNTTMALETSINFLELSKSTASKSLYEDAEYSPEGPQPMPPNPPTPSKTIVTKEVMSQIMIDKGISGYVVSTTQELKDALAAAVSGDKVVIIGNIDMGEAQLNVGNGIQISGANAIISEFGLNNNFEVLDEAKLSFDYTQNSASTNAFAIKMGNNSELSDISFDYDTKYNNSLISASGSGIKMHNIKVSLDSKIKTGAAGFLIEITGDVSLSGYNKVEMKGETLTWNFGGANYYGKFYLNRDAVLDFDGGGEGTLLRGGSATINGTINAKNINTLIVYANGSTGATINGTINIKNHTGNNLFSNSKLSLGASSVFNVASGAKTSIFGEISTEFQTGAEFNFYQNGTISAWKATGNGSYNGLITLNGSSDFDVVSNNWKKTSRPGTPEEILPKTATSGIKEKIFSKSMRFDIKEELTGHDYRGSSQQFNEIISQYDKIIKDANYLGNNLLLQQNLKVIFNETSSSFLSIQGIDASLNGLNLSYTDWNSKEDIMATISKLDTAISKMRNYSREFGNYYNTVNIRKDFTDAMVNLLHEGADKLTLADMNQASADILSLQTRQQLAINSMSLASRASQNILKIFM